jgi:L-threonylcarbamoyladenylate synthase
MKSVSCSDAGLDAAAEILLAGGIAVIPTDTVYGLAAHPACPAAVQRLYTVKGREEGKPIALLASDTEAVARFGFSLSPKAQKLADSHWPGALTLVLSNGEKTEGFRIPNHEWTRRLIAKCGGVLRVTSANLSGGEDAVEATEAIKSVGLSADIIADGGKSQIGTPSTVVLIDSAGAAKILRQGTVKLHES